MPPRAYLKGYANAESGGLVYDGLPFNPTRLQRAEAVAGFEARRIARRVGSWPVLLADVGKPGVALWAVGPCLFQATSGPDVRPDANGAGYRDLGALLKLKGVPHA